MIAKIISGGQTGADAAGLRAARRFGVATGGFAPKGWLTEDGPAPWLADYGLTECPTPGYPARTRANAEAAHLTLWFDYYGAYDSPGYRATHKAAIYFLGIDRRPGSLPAKQFVTTFGPSLNGVINVAGNRESKAPGIGAWVESYLCEVLRELGFVERSEG